MGVAEKQTVADIGSGFGFFTLAAAEVVGRDGFVYSVEPVPQRSERIRSRIKAEGIENVKVLTTGAEYLDEIPSEVVDTAFSAFSLHHFEDPPVAMAEIRRILHTGGLFYVWDRVPGRIMKHGTRPEDITRLSPSFENLEILSSRRILRARLTK